MLFVVQQPSSKKPSAHTTTTLVMKRGSSSTSNTWGSWGEFTGVEAQDLASLGTFLSTKADTRDLRRIGYHRVAALVPRLTWTEIGGEQGALVIALPSGHHLTSDSDCCCSTVKSARLETKSNAMFA